MLVSETKYLIFHERECNPFMAILRTLAKHDLAFIHIIPTLVSVWTCNDAWIVRDWTLLHVHVWFLNFRLGR